MHHASSGESIVRQIIYFSTATVLQTEQLVADVLQSSRRSNEQKQVTGLLIAGGNRYLQVIEGQADALKMTMERILSDWRHTRIDVLVDRKVTRRAFTDWSMAFCSDPELGGYASFGAMVSILSDTVEPHLRAQVELLATTFTSTPLRPASPWSELDPPRT